MDLEIISLNDVIIRKTCPHAQYRMLRDGPAIFCEEKKGKDAPSQIQFMNIQEGEVCVATSFFQTGHIGYSSSVNIGKISECPYKNSNT